MKRSRYVLRMKLMTGPWLIIAILLAVIPAGGDARGLRERIINTALRPANMDIYLFDSPGKEPRRLTDHTALDYNPAFSRRKTRKASPHHP